MVQKVLKILAILAAIYLAMWCCNDYAFSNPLTALQQTGTGGIHASWDPNTENDLAGYRIYYGTTSGNYTNSIDVGNVTTYVFDPQDFGKTYYVALTAYDIAGNESLYSQEASIFLPGPTDMIPTITGITPDNLNKEIFFEWSPVEASNVAGYNVYLGTASGNHTVKVQLTIADYPDPDQFRNNPAFTWENLTNGVYYLAVSAFDDQGNEYSKSNERSVKIEDQDVTPPAPPGGLKLELVIILGGLAFIGFLVFLYMVSRRGNSRIAFTNSGGF